MLKQPPAVTLLQRTRFSIASTAQPTSLPSSLPSSLSNSGSKSAAMSAPDVAAPKLRSSSASINANASEDVKQGKPPARGGLFFPLGYRDAAYQWWTSITPPVAERNVLAFMPYIRDGSDRLTDPAAADKPDPFGTRVWKRSLVQLSGKDRALNEISIERVGEEEEETLVMLHGYGAGLGFFYKNLEPITRLPGLKLYAIDMLGMGNSTRPPFTIRAKTREGKITEAENWFIDALEEWRKARKIERFTLLGHSLGGYLAVSYAIKYPGHLKKLILASPVGVPEDPYAVNAALPEPGESTLQNEFTQDQTTVTADNTPQSKQASSTPSTQSVSTAPKRPLPSWLVWLWDANFSPFTFVRLAGPLGPRFVSGWTSRRFNHLPEDEAQALHDYTFSIFKQKGSGEFALAYILAPGAYARSPVINRIQDVGRQLIPQPDGAKAIQETGIPIVFMYGENDWMDVAGGLAAEEKLKATRIRALQNATAEEKRKENGSAKVIIVPKAGHHLYLDNSEYFNEVLRKEMVATMEAEKRKRAAS